MFTVPTKMVIRPVTNDAKIIWKIIWNQKRKAELKSKWTPLVRSEKLAWEIPIPLDYFFDFFNAKGFILCEKLSDYGITRPRGTSRETGHTGLLWYWAVFGCSCCIRDLTALFVPFFGLFQIIFQVIFASFVPKVHFLSKSKRLLVIFRSFFR